MGFSLFLLLFVVFRRQNLLFFIGYSEDFQKFELFIIESEEFELQSELFKIFSTEFGILFAEFRILSAEFKLWHYEFRQFPEKSQSENIVFKWNFQLFIYSSDLFKQNYSIFFLSSDLSKWDSDLFQKKGQELEPVLNSLL